MSHKTIRWTKRALRRLDEIGAHIEKDSPEAASRVIARILSAAELLTQQPAMGRVGRIKATRELVLVDIPYIVPYRVSGNTVEILTVIHAAQQWPRTL
ncbi:MULTISPECIES: type II toxin-antitoxin system RelE/ParE family toxin [Mesorhizobium]|uniref:Toxin Y4kP n=4 Tax=Mesorhizobium TaxID=68287 RepID=A0A1A5I5N3_RHILI|nr:MULTISPECIES: type II toxin-antitoxin system RelE/ParE family toxin [Mesorhizobium]MBE1706192.1 type II toxin-antitoxin system RelE/ParE family toxin [Mesorhizobium japonicum]MBE1715297.1 type II toxin-antitoxin system RelE/ParE family toxin [Mesorhizobium japonicum]MUT21883.1 type II toxin-antitoxin system mRNA interferase toxin, RelE/StbE family [Mesorhizobium japonicum]MUT27734.1 type II toxin-antitoxin system mRNA interferase toxin, RelE/StbE family [Mesorhizobium japonicum]OBP74335.1 t